MLWRCREERIDASTVTRQFKRTFNEVSRKKLGKAARLFSAHGRFACFEHLRIQDSKSFALKTALAKTFPGRFTTISPAAVELHADLDLLREELNRVTLSVDSEAARQFVREFEEVAGSLLLAGRGYVSTA